MGLLNGNGALWTKGGFWAGSEGACLGHGGDRGGGRSESGMEPEQDRQEKQDIPPLETNMVSKLTGGGWSEGTFVGPGVGVGVGVGDGQLGHGVAGTLLSAL